MGSVDWFGWLVNMSTHRRCQQSIFPRPIPSWRSFKSSLGVLKGTWGLGQSHVLQNPKYQKSSVLRGAMAFDHLGANGVPPLNGLLIIFPRHLVDWGWGESNIRVPKGIWGPWQSHALQKSKFHGFEGIWLGSAGGQWVTCTEGGFDNFPERFYKFWMPRNQFGHP